MGGVFFITHNQKPLYLFLYTSQYSSVFSADNYSCYQLNIDGKGLFNMFIPRKNFGRMGDLDLRASTMGKEQLGSGSHLSVVEDCAHT